MKDYELTVLFHPDLEMNLEPALEKVKKLIKNAGGQITNEENDGKKRIAYKIKNQDFAIYYYVDVQLPAEAPTKISNSLNINDEVLRYLLVKTDPRKAKLNQSTEAVDTEKDSTNSQEKGE